MIQEIWNKLSIIDVSEEKKKRSCSVECQVTISGITKKMFLAVTDYNNKAIENPSSVDINNTKMRCLTKCIATGFGLGWYIYKGDALPPEEFYTEEQTAEFAELIEHECFKGKKNKVKDELRKSTSKSNYQRVLNKMKKTIEDYENQQAEEINQDLDNQMKGKL